MSKFGTGFGKDKNLIDTRPCNRVVSAQNQRIYNQWFQRDNSSGNRFKDERPDWWRGKQPQPGERAPSPTRLGEWQLVWRPNGAPTPPGPKPKTVVPKSGKDHQELLQKLTVPSRKAGYHTRGSMTGILDAGGMLQPADKGGERRAASSLGLSRIDNERDALVSAGSQGSKGLRIPIKKAEPEVEEIASQGLPSARSQLTTVSARSAMSMQSKRSGRAYSVRSRSSAATYSGLSGVSSQFDQDEILKRIQGLEDALKAEKNLRQLMQTLLETQTGAKVA